MTGIRFSDVAERWRSEMTAHLFSSRNPYEHYFECRVCTVCGASDVVCRLCSPKAAYTDDWTKCEHGYEGRMTVCNEHPNGFPDPFVAALHDAEDDYAEDVKKHRIRPGPAWSLFQEYRADAVYIAHLAKRCDFPYARRPFMLILDCFELLARRAADHAGTAQCGRKDHALAFSACILCGRFSVVCQFESDRTIQEKLRCDCKYERISYVPARWYDPDGLQNTVRELRTAARTFDRMFNEFVKRGIDVWGAVVGIDLIVTFYRHAELAAKEFDDEEVTA